MLFSSPYLEILPAPQRRLWDELRQVPSDFVLYGGTALALRLGHRQSLDFDFFGRRELDPLTFPDTVDFLKDARVIQRDRNTLSVIVERGGPVQVSKDCRDIDALIAAGIDLPQALAAAKAIYGASFNPQITLTSDTEAVARRVIWFEPPAEALSDSIRFMAYAMTYGTHEDMQVLRRHVSDAGFREALDRAPAGIIDARSWAYWNSKLGRWPAPPMPRRFGNAPPMKYGHARI
jgi:hypothetical protein